MTKGVSKKLQRDDQRRKKRAQTATGFAQTAATPQRVVPVQTAATRHAVAPAGARDKQLPPMRYPVTRAAIGKRQEPQTARGGK
jgi:hypothetical protein